MKASFGNFYFLSDQYFIDFPDKNLMLNKENGNGRPCFYSIYDKNTGLYWMVPISSQINKYKAIYSNIIADNGFCMTLHFAFLAGKEKAFLIQNMCPTNSTYIVDEYIDQKTNSPFRIIKQDEKEIFEKMKWTLRQVRKGNTRLVFPDVLKIEKELLKN